MSDDATDVRRPPRPDDYRPEYRRPPLAPGTRVRHHGEQYPEAYRDGTAVVLYAFVYNGHLEYRVCRDRPLVEGMSAETDWSDEATYVIDGSAP